MAAEEDDFEDTVVGLDATFAFQICAEFIAQQGSDGLHILLLALWQMVKAGFHYAIVLQLALNATGAQWIEFSLPSSHPRPQSPSPVCPD